ncbi:phage terminase small subunit [Mixta mediterraneensis]|uniref:phage terminase small subunit n=1 Tax=Mixta mediterraneensis TaxID=2758443 RepID=UPI001876EDF0|nr:phage terminase small subunit [Mixta mediterraneensis]MBE5254164.1 terminase [Mixta mediterraneensis]
MRLSPAQRHSQRIAMQQQLARLEAINTADSLHMQIQEIEADVVRLRSLDMTADRVEMKRDVLLPKWLPTVESYLELGKVYANPVFAWCVIWLFDVGQFDQALDWADIAVEQQQETPGNFRTRFPAFVADQMLEWAEQASQAGEGLEPYFSRTFENVTQRWRLHEEITAKWFKFAGLLLLRDESGQARAAASDSVETLSEADRLLAAAEAKYHRAGVSTMRKTIAARIRALTAE